MDDSGLPRTHDRPVKFLGTRVRYQRSVETTIDARVPDFLGGSATAGHAGVLPRRQSALLHTLSSLAHTSLAT